LSSQENYHICGEARNGAEALSRAKELEPDLILLDVSLPDINGLEVAVRLRKEVPKTKVLIISQHDPVRLLASALEAGAQGCIDKSRLAPDLLKTIESVMAAK
jgi:DNA-binding NarL/FixJ family response regulator